MSIAGILSSALFSAGAQSLQSKPKDFRQEFQQLGQDLQSGNLTAANADLTALQQQAPAAASSSSSPLSQAFNQLAQDVKAGNTSAAQQDYATLEQGLKTQVAGHPHHHHGGGGESKAVSQLLDQLGQELQSGDLAGAQQAYGTLQQTFQALQDATKTGAGSVSLSA